MAAKMGGFRSPNGIRKPKTAAPGALQKPGQMMQPMGMPGMKKGGFANKMIGGSRKKK